VNSIILALLGVVIPVIAGFLAKELALFNSAINKLPAPFPTLIAVVVAFGASALSQAVGLVLPGDLAGFSQDVIAAILTAVSQILVHAPAALQGVRFARGLEK